MTQQALLTLLLVFKDAVLNPTVSVMNKQVHKHFHIFMFLVHSCKDPSWIPAAHVHILLRIVGTLLLSLTVFLISFFDFH